MRSATTALRRESDTVSRCLFRPIMQQLDNKRVQVCLFFVNERWQWDLLSQKTVNHTRLNGCPKMFGLDHFINFLKLFCYYCCCFCKSVEAQNRKWALLIYYLSAKDRTFSWKSSIFESPSFIISFRVDGFNTVEVNLPIALASAMTLPRISSSVTLEINNNYGRVSKNSHDNFLWGP